MVGLDNMAKSGIIEHAKEYGRLFFLLMTLGLPFTFLIGFIEILVLEFLLSLFEYHLLMSICDLINSLFNSNISEYSSISVVLLGIINCLLGSVTICVMCIWAKIHGEDRSLNHLPEERRKEFEDYGTSIDYLGPGPR